MIISLFGGSTPNEETYNLAAAIGKRIAKKGYVLKNGANSGIMEASSKAAIEAGGEVIGVAVKNAKVNSLKYQTPYLTKLIETENIQERITELMNANRIIILDGQIGTLEELFISWSKAIVNQSAPIVIMGKKNKLLFNFLKENNFIKEDEQMPYIQFANSIDEIDFLN